jgi:hypothetical protein
MSLSNVGYRKDTIQDSPSSDAPGDIQPGTFDLVEQEFRNRNEPNAARLAADEASYRSAVHALDYTGQTAAQAGDGGDGE